jgi:hypothetical protein
LFKKNNTIISFTLFAHATNCLILSSIRCHSPSVTSMADGENWSGRVRCLTNLESFRSDRIWQDHNMAQLPLWRVWIENRVRRFPVGVSDEC